MAKVIVVTSGKGGVGKTTSAAAIATGLALLGKKTVVIDFDVGLRNLDLIMGCERRVVFDFINVINDGIRLHQALIKDKRVENLYVLPTSQTRDKDALDLEGVEKALDELKLRVRLHHLRQPGRDRAAARRWRSTSPTRRSIVTNPEVSSVRDSDRIIGILNSKSRRAERGEEPVKQHLLLTRYDPARVEKGEMLKVEDVLEILAIPLLGVIPQDDAVLQASNVGMPVVLDERSKAGQAYTRRGRAAWPASRSRCGSPPRPSAASCSGCSGGPRETVRVLRAATVVRPRRTRPSSASSWSSPTTRAPAATSSCRCCSASSWR